MHSPVSDVQNVIPRSCPIHITRSVPPHSCVVPRASRRPATCCCRTPRRSRDSPAQAWDVLRRFVGRVSAHCFTPHLQQTWLPHQFGLSTRAGTETLARVPRVAILSVDAAGAYGRGSPLGALPRLAGTRGSTRFPRTSRRARVGTGRPFNAWPVFARCPCWAPGGTGRLARALEACPCPSQARRVWNAAGEEPAHICALQLVGAVTVRVRDGELPHDQWSHKVPGTPLGTHAYVQRQLSLKGAGHDRVLQAVPALGDLQAAWLFFAFLRCTACQLLAARPSANRNRGYSARPCGRPTAKNGGTACCPLWRPRPALRIWRLSCGPLGSLGFLVRHIAGCAGPCTGSSRTDAASIAGLAC